MRILLAPLLLVLSCSQVYAQSGPEIKFPKAGYAIKHLDQGPANDAPFESMKMLLPSKDGFASNVNIQHQPYPGSLKDYMQLSKTQSVAAGMTVLSESVDDAGYSAEATGEFGRYKLRFYFRAIKVGDNIILATATSPEERWEWDKKILAPVVDSLRAMAAVDSEAD